MRIYTTSALTASTVIDVRFAAKKTVSVTANPLSATKDEVLAGKNLPVITFTPNTIAGQKVQYKNASGALSDKLPAADGVYIDRCDQSRDRGNMPPEG